MIFKNMFQAKTALMAVAMVLFTGSFTACSDDDDNEGGGSTLTTPKYESVSAKYVASSQDAAYKSVELTASGNYIIMLNTNNGYNSDMVASTGKQSRVTMLKNKLVAATRASFGDIIYGKYTIESDGVYKLEGFGTVTVDMDGDDVAALTIKKAGEEPYVLTADIESQCPNSDITNSLCRTWNAETIGMKIVYNGKTYFNKTVDVENVSDLIAALERLEGEGEDDEYYEGEESYEEESELEQYMPKEVVFTKAGTYMVRYKNETLGISTWAWENEKKGILRYSWDYDDMYDEYVAGTATVSFKNGWLYVAETYTESEDGETLSETVTYGFSEMK